MQVIGFLYLPSNDKSISSITLGADSKVKAYNFGIEFKVLLMNAPAPTNSKFSSILVSMHWAETSYFYRKLLLCFVMDSKEFLDMFAFAVSIDKNTSLLFEGLESPAAFLSLSESAIASGVLVWPILPKKLAIVENSPLFRFIILSSSLPGNHP